MTLTTGPCLRLESLVPSGATSSGRCANCGGLGAEALEDEQVLEGVGEVVLAADDVADAEIGIVDAGGEVVGGHAVLTEAARSLRPRRRVWTARRRRRR